MARKSYQEALEYLYGFLDYERRPPGDPQRYDLSRARKLLRALGQPQQSYDIVHVAGTKGKGSTCAMVESILRASGLRTGLYTQPHLHTFRERIRVADRMIGEDSFARQLGAIAPLANRVPRLTTYELATALALHFFAEEAVDVAVLEVGLGGRLDATNVVMPTVSVITRIGYDHTEILGTRLDQIATEKAGIVKPGRPVVLAPQRPTADRAVARICRQRGSPLFRVGRLYSWRRAAWDLSGQEFQLDRDDGRSLGELRVPLLGDHQLENAATAVAGCEALAKTGRPIPEDAVRRGLATTEWPARLEILTPSPLVIADGAHNVDSAEALSQALSTYFPGREISWILGFLSGHDVPQFLRTISRRGGHAIFTQSQHPRAIDPSHLASLAARTVPIFEVAATTDQALDRALARTGPDLLICATGSLSIAAEVRAAWLRSQGRPPPADPPVPAVAIPSIPDG